MPRGDAAIINKLGLHARAAAKLVSLAKTFESDIKLQKDASSEPVDAKSIMSVLLLEATCGSTVELTVDGADAQEAADAIAALFADRFGEGE